MDSQYRSILKATSIFGGTQFVQILVGLVRSKFVALLIGTTGMGLNSIYMSSLTVFITVFGMGINMSVVKDLSKAYDARDWQGYAKISKAFNRILLFLGITGTLFVIAISSLLSDWSFNDHEHIGAFCFLSLIVFFTLLSQGNTALLISSRRIKSTASCSLVSSIASLLIAVPFFYFWRLDGVVPGIVFSTIANYVVTLFYVRNIKLESCELSVNETWKLARSFIVLGMAMVIASLMGNVTSYLINLFINRLGGLSDLGLYGAGFTITFQTLSMVFAAMGADYFPRLSAAMGNKDRMNQTINEQSEILLLLSTPILAVFMIVAPIIIRVLLSEEFLPVTGFIRVLCLGMLLRAASYALGYASFAKGDKKIYLFVEGGYSNVSNLLLAVLFYYLWGLNGMAWAFVLNYLLYYLVIRYIDTWRYGYKISNDLIRLIVYSTIALSWLLCVTYIMADAWYYSLGSVFAIGICFYNLKKLNQKTDLFNKLSSQIGFPKSR